MNKNYMTGEEIKQMFPLSSTVKGNEFNMNYEEIKDSIMLRPYSIYDNFINGVAHYTVGDIALVPYSILYSDDNLTASINVPATVEDVWDMDVLFKDAMANTVKYHMPKIMRINENFTFDEYDLDEFASMSHSKYDAYALTSNRNDGSVCAFMPGVCKRIADSLEDDIYLAFTARHEAMLHAVSLVDAKAVYEVLNEIINKLTRENEVITHSVYRYYRDADEIKIYDVGEGDE